MRSSRRVRCETVRFPVLSCVSPLPRPSAMPSSPPWHCTSLTRQSSCGPPSTTSSVLLRCVCLNSFWAAPQREPPLKESYPYFASNGSCCFCWCGFFHCSARVTRVKCLTCVTCHICHTCHRVQSVTPVAGGAQLVVRRKGATIMHLLFNLQSSVGQGAAPFWSSQAITANGQLCC